MKLYDKDKKTMNLRYNNLGAILSKGKREIYFIFKSVSQGEKTRKLIAENSFNKLFNKGRKLKLFGSNISHIKLK